MKIAVHSGGHSWVHSSVRDGGMLIDLGRLRAAKIDAGTRSAEVEPALTARDFAAALAEQGLAFPVAHCGSVALGGYLLGGGSGWNGRAWGQVACFNVEAIECVLASGKLIEADSARNAEIFWAARGAGPGFFGVVTRFMLKLQPLPRAITSSNYCWPIERAPVIAAWLQALQPGFAPEVETLMFMASAPPDLAEHCRPHGRMCSVGVTVFADTLEQARARLDPVAAQVPAEGLFLRDEQVATPFEALFAGVDQAFAPHRFGSDTLWSHEPLERVVTPLVERVISAPSPNSLVLCEARRKFGPYPDAAYSLAARSFVDVYAVWSEAAADGANVDWLRGSMAAIEPMGAGFYINESDLTASPTRAEHSYEPANWARLKALRAKYDPERRFHWYLGRPQDE